MYKWLRHICAPALALTALTACSDSGQPTTSIPGNAIYDFVTVVKSVPHGTAFDFQRIDDSPVIRYLTPFSFTENDRINEGDRLIICFTKPQGDLYSSGNIDLYGYITPANTERSVVTGTAEQYNNFASQPGRMTAMWRTGKFINMQSDVFLRHVGRPERMIIVADSTTVSDPYPQLHIICDMPQDNVGLNSHIIYSSFDISPIWDLETCQGVDISFVCRDSIATMSFLKSL